MVRYKELYTTLDSYPTMQKTLSFGQYQATSSRGCWVFISFAGRWEWWSDGALIAGFPVYMMQLLQSDDACCCSFHVAKRSVTAVVDFWQIKMYDFSTTPQNCRFFNFPSFVLTQLLSKCMRLRAQIHSPTSAHHLTHLSIQTVNMCSKYLNVISRKSESLIPVTIIIVLLGKAQEATYVMLNRLISSDKQKPVVLK